MNVVCYVIKFEQLRLTNILKGNLTKWVEDVINTKLERKFITCFIRRQTQFM